MTKLEALVALNMIDEIGSIRLKRLVEYLGSPEEALRASRHRLTAIYGIGERIADKIISLKKEVIGKELGLAKKMGLRIITIEDDDYPVNLKNIFDPPIVLYLKGKLKPEDSFAIGLVGSRRASFYGLSQAEGFSAGLAAHGFTIISGMARGIDTYSHRGALKSGGRTIAVIGSGFNYLYPAENKKLAEEISENGAVISEFSLDTKPLPQNFPRRNRLISGMSLGVLVVEAARNSGALITADFALEQGREVFAIPGKIDSPTSFGTNELIKQGAKLTSNVFDILEEFIQPAPVDKKELINDEKSSVSGEEERLLNLISVQAVQLEELVERTEMDIPQISAVLLKLQIQKLVKQLPGKQFVRCS
ncbi:MAG: DNA-processing protein DprA [Candidatus Omnitrophota bacterium]|jgi:DNA processing protein